MRLICPNCDAEYEVDDAVIPQAGRDVQCSNCGHTWFQRPDGETADPDAPALDDTQGAAADAPDPEETKDAPGHAPRRQPLDEDIANVLREEAEREERARRSEGLESQPDLGLEDPGTDARRGLRERMARLRGVAPDGDGEDSDAEDANPSRRELLPDIEEINSTLRAESERQGAVANLPRDAGPVLENAELPRKRGRFGLGFGIVMLIGALIVGIYLAAPGIAALLPAIKPVMADYVMLVDAARLGAQQWIVTATEWLIVKINAFTA